jgi:hypothetical protein
MSDSENSEKYNPTRVDALGELEHEDDPELEAQLNFDSDEEGEQAAPPDLPSTPQEEEQADFSAGVDSDFNSLESFATDAEGGDEDETPPSFDEDAQTDPEMELPAEFSASEEGDTGFEDLKDELAGDLVGETTENDFEVPEGALDQEESTDPFAASADEQETDFGADTFGDFASEEPQEEVSLEAETEPETEPETEAPLKLKKKSLWNSIQQNLSLKQANLKKLKKKQ